MNDGFEPGVHPQGEISATAHTFAFYEHRLLVQVGGGGARPPFLGELEAWLAAHAQGPPRRQYLGLLNGHQVVAFELGEIAEPPSGMAFKGLRSLYEHLEESLFLLAGRAFQIVGWDRDHQFCGRCGSANEDHSKERAKLCPRCGLSQHPRLSPAVIVLVERGDEILLARSPHFLPGMYSTLAGFVEPGETLEQTVAREIREEVGVEVRNVRYFGSQPWPFPHSLMIGFTAEWAAGDIVIDGEEIEDAAWFSRDRLPSIPPRLSIARELIDTFLARV